MKATRFRLKDKLIYLLGGSVRAGGPWGFFCVAKGAPFFYLDTLLEAGLLSIWIPKKEATKKDKLIYLFWVGLLKKLCLLYRIY